MNGVIRCPMCGAQFRPDQDGPCAACPLNRNCRVLACCPQCGYEVVNPDGSRLARWLNRNFGLVTQRLRAATNAGQSVQGVTLADAPLGHPARVRGFAADIPAQRRAHLEAYGVDEGALVTVLQHTPVVVLQVDNLEVALERELAGQILVGEGIGD